MTKSSEIRSALDPEIGTEKLPQADDETVDRYRLLVINHLVSMFGGTLGITRESLETEKATALIRRWSVHGIGRHDVEPILRSAERNDIPISSPIEYVDKALAATRQTTEAAIDQDKPAEETREETREERIRRQANERSARQIEQNRRDSEINREERDRIQNSPEVQNAREAARAAISTGALPSVEETGDIPANRYRNDQR